MVPIAEKLYKHVLDHNDVELWYHDSFYNIDECWKRAVSDATASVELYNDDLMALITWVNETAPDDMWSAFSDGFPYYIGAAFAAIYELGE